MMRVSLTVLFASSGGDAEGGVDKNEMDGLRLSIGSLKDAVIEEDPLKSNRALSRLLEQDREETPIGIEEVGKSNQSDTS